MSVSTTMWQHTLPRALPENQEAECKIPLTLYFNTGTVPAFSSRPSVVRYCCPFSGGSMPRRSLSPTTGWWPALLAVCLSSMILGCAALSSRPHLASGHPSVTWQATDFRVIARTVEGAERDLYTFTLVLDET